jgi:hypothetical protein
VREQFIEINLITNPAKESCNFSVEITAVEPEGAKIDDKCGSTMVVITNDPEYEKVMKEVLSRLLSRLLFDPSRGF